MKTSALVPQALLTLIAGFACDAAMARTVHDAGLGAYGYECQHCRLEYGELMGFFGSLDEYDPAIRYDPETGEDLRNFAPDRKVDYKHMRLIMTIPDMNEPSFSATQRLIFEPIAKPLETLRLNAMQMNIERVRVDPLSPTVSSTE